MPGRNKHVWMFNSGDTFTGNPKWLFVYVSKFRPDITAYWLCETEQTARYVRSLGFRALTFKDPRTARVQARTGVYVVNQVKEQIPDKLRGAVFLNLWHGVGIKSVERNLKPGSPMEANIARKYIRNNSLYRNNQLFLATSEVMERNFAAQLGLDEISIVRGGYPQNLYPKEIGSYSTYDHDILRERGLPDNTRIAFYAPTWRKGVPGFLHSSMPDVERLVEELERTNTLLIVKVHPYMSGDRYLAALTESFGSRPNILFWNNELDIYEIFPQIDLAIVDYSSILYDLLAAGVRNVIRYVFDYDEVSTDVVDEGFDYFELSCGTVARSFDQLLTALGDSNTVADDDLSRLDELFWGYSDKGTFERLINRALEYEPRQTQLPTLHTFDVFDTVIHRRGVTPASVFHYVKQQMECGELDFPPWLVARYPEIRVEAETGERDSRRRRPELVRGARLEVRFEEIHQRIAEMYDLTPEQTTALQQWEIEAEIASVFADQVVVSNIHEIIGKGDPVLLVSDMYLPRSTVTKLLETADPFLASLPLYLSSDTREQKSTKSLFLKVYREMRYDFAEWIHHGDSPWGDVKQAQALGITAEPVPRTTFDKFETGLSRSGGTFDTYLYAGMLRAFRVESSALGDGVPQDLQDSFILNHVASYWVPYIDWAIRDAVRRDYRTLYFVSRDGHHLKRIADALIAERGLGLRTRYIYGSRTAWRVASQIDELDTDLFEPHGDFLNVVTVQALLDNARLSHEEFKSLFPELSSVSDADLEDREMRATVVGVMAGSAKFRGHLLDAAARERALAVRYLRQEMNFDEPFAVVEFWGSGYTQTCLARLVVESASRAIDTPVYYYRSVRTTEGHAVRHRFTTTMQSPLFVEAIFANHPHGTVLGYREAGEHVEPVVAPRVCSSELFARMEELLPEHARRYAQLDFVDPERAARDIFRFAFKYYRRHPKSRVFVENIAPLFDAVGIGAREREFAPGMTRADLRAHKSGESFRTKTHSMPLTLARSSEWVRVRYNLHAEPPGKTPEWKKAALLGRAFARTGYRRAAKRIGAR